MLPRSKFFIQEDLGRVLAHKIVVSAYLATTYGKKDFSKESLLTGR